MTQLTVRENNTLLSFSFEELLKYHGPGFPGGVAHAFKVMERAFPLLDTDAPLERRELRITTAFPGLGARDAFELVTRCVIDQRYVLDTKLPEAADVFQSANGHYYFRFEYRNRAVAVTIRKGHVREEFVMLGRKTERTEEEGRRLEELKQEMADRLMKLSAEEIYDALVLEDFGGNGQVPRNQA